MIAILPSSFSMQRILMPWPLKREAHRRSPIARFSGLLCGPIYPLVSALGEVVVGKFPVDQVPECFDVAWTRVAIVDVVRVFPHIAGQDRFVSARQRGSRIMSRFNRKRPVRFSHQPGPAAAKVSSSRFGELLFEFVEAAKPGLNRVGYCSFRRGARFWCKALPVEAVVEMLRRIVKQPAARRGFNDVLERLALVGAALNQVVQVVDISSVMFPVMVFECFGRQMGL